MKKDDFIGIRLPSEIKKELEQLAQADDRTLSQYCLKILKQHLEKEHNISFVSLMVCPI